jgi:hypothetical protein
MLLSLIVQAPEGTSGFDAQLAEIVAGLAKLEQDMVPFEVEGTAEWRTLWGEEHDPPLQTEFLLQLDRHAVLVVIRDGVDPQDPYLHNHGLPYPPRVKLLVRGGRQEWYDVDREQLTIHENLGLQSPHESMSLLSPGPLIWSLGGAYRSRFVALADWTSLTRNESLGTIDLRFGNRISDTSRTTNELRFRSDWGYLAVDAALLGRVGDEYEPVLRGTVRSVQRTRLGVVPATADYYSTQGFSPEGRPIPNVHGRLVFRNYRFTGVSVPRSIRHLDAEQLASMIGGTSRVAIDALSSDTSAFAVTKKGTVESWNGRELQMDRLVPSSLTRDVVSLEGTKLSVAQRLVGSRWAYVACLGIAILLGSRRSSTARWAAAIVVLTAGGLLASGAFQARASSGLESPVVPLEGQVSEVLCGVDALYLASSLTDAASETTGASLYTTLVEIIEPIDEGTTMADLAIAAECLGLAESLVRIRGFSHPPSPLIVHLRGDHFAACFTRADTDAVVLIDPSRGAYETSWPEVKALAGPIGLWVR